MAKIILPLKKTVSKDKDGNDVETNEVEVDDALLLSTLESRLSREAGGDHKRLNEILQRDATKYRLTNAKYLKENTELKTLLEQFPENGVVLSPEEATEYNAVVAYLTKANLIEDGKPLKAEVVTRAFDEFESLKKKTAELERANLLSRVAKAAGYASTAPAVLDVISAQYGITFAMKQQPSSEDAKVLVDVPFVKVTRDGAVVEIPLTEYIDTYQPIFKPALLQSNDSSGQERGVQTVKQHAATGGKNETSVVSDYLNSRYSQKT